MKKKWNTHIESVHPNRRNADRNLSTWAANVSRDIAFIIWETRSTAHTNVMTAHTVSITMAHEEQDEVEAMPVQRHQEWASAQDQNRQRLAESDRGTGEGAAAAVDARASDLGQFRFQEERRRIQGECECMAAKVRRPSEGALVGTGPCDHASSAPAFGRQSKSLPIDAQPGWRRSELDVAATSLQRIKWRTAPGIVDPQKHSTTSASTSKLGAKSQGAPS